MSKGRMSALRQQQAITASLDIPVDSAEVSQRLWRKLLRPQFVEGAISVIDFCLIIAAALVCSSAYHWIFGDRGNVIPFVGIGIVVATNFAAVMMARRNYRLKRLTLFS